MPANAAFGFIGTYLYREGSVSPGTLLEEMGTAVKGVGPGNSLADKIVLAQTYWAVPDQQSTCAVLNAFLNQVRAKDSGFWQIICLQLKNTDIIMR